MKKTFLLTSILACTLSMTVTSCGSKTTENNQSTEVSVRTTISVDEILTNPADYVDKTVTVEGVCSHLCKHGGRKAFLAGSANNFLIRCEAFPVMGTPFPASTIHHPMTVTGVLREERVDEAAVQEMERIYAEAQFQAQQDSNDVASQSEIGASCDTEQAARGQQGLADFNARMADYRARIARREAAEGIPYLSFYYIEAADYNLLDD